MFDMLAILGVGLIGGSLGLAARERGLARHVVGYARRTEVRDSALACGAVDTATDDLVAAVRRADCVFLATPLGVMRELCEQIAPHVRPDALVTDGGSVKGSVMRECAPLFEGGNFVGGHPMAGSEKSGVSAARANLFEGATWALTPTLSTNPQATEQLVALIEAVGARPLTLSPDEHDNLVAVTSHLPHMTAAALVHRFAEARASHPEAVQLTAGGWRDSTRVAAGDTTMWRDITLANAPALLATLDGMMSELQSLRALIADGESETLFHWLDAASQVRKNHPKP